MCLTQQSCVHYIRYFIYNFFFLGKKYNTFNIDPNIILKVKEVLIFIFSIR